MIDVNTGGLASELLFGLVFEARDINILESH